MEDEVVGAAIGRHGHRRGETSPRRLDEEMLLLRRAAARLTDAHDPSDGVARGGLPTMLLPWLQLDAVNRSGAVYIWYRAPSS